MELPEEISVSRELTQRMLFLPTSISILVLRADLSHTSLPPEDVQFGIGIELRGIDSVWLILYCFQEEIAGDESKSIQVSESCRLILDVLTDIRREGVIQRSDGQVSEILFTYHRLDEIISFEAIVSGPDGHTELHALDFLLGQYAIKENIVDREIFSVGGGSADDRNHNNIVAKGFESSGVIARQVLKTSGEYTGHLIRYLGRKFTEVTVTPTTAPEMIDPKLLVEAQRRREWAEGFNSGARTLTSTILYPVRWTGQKAAKMAQVDHHLDHNLDARERNLVTHKQRNSVTSSTSHSIKKALWDTVEGMGNGVTSVFKGVTEAMSEVGSAIGDSAMHHARMKYGEEYANQITKSYVDAASEIGLAGYKVANVFSFGIAGLMIDVVVEGTTLLVSLYDYLVGPIILQGYMTLVQPPLFSPKRYFVVLRPWSLSFYQSPQDIIHKPFKIIPTFLLDTIPRLRRRQKDVVNGDDSFAADDAVEAVPVTRPEPTIATRSVLYNSEGEHSEDNISIIEADGVSYIMLPPSASSATATGPSSDKAHQSEMSAASADRPTRTQQIADILRRWSGGNQSHIELTTIDCSTYLLYPEYSIDERSDYHATHLTEEALLETWFHELEIAVKRVETLAKRRSEAIALAYHKRLRTMPKPYILEIRPVRFVHVQQHKDVGTVAAGAPQSSKRSADATAADATEFVDHGNNDFSLFEEDDDEADEGDNNDVANMLGEEEEEQEMLSNLSSAPNSIAEQSIRNMTSNFQVYQRVFHPNSTATSSSAAYDSIISNAEQAQEYRLDSVFAEQDAKFRWQQQAAVFNENHASHTIGVSNEDNDSFSNDQSAEDLTAHESASANAQNATAEGMKMPEPIVIIRRASSSTNQPSGSSWLASATSWTKSMTKKKKLPPSYMTMSVTPITHSDLILVEEAKLSMSAQITTLADQLDALRVLLLNNSPESLGSAAYEALSSHVQQFEHVDNSKRVVEWQFQRYLQWMGIDTAPLPVDDIMALQATATTAAKPVSLQRQNEDYQAHFLQVGTQYNIFEARDLSSAATTSSATSSNGGRLEIAVYTSAAAVNVAEGASTAEEKKAKKRSAKQKVVGHAIVSLSDLTLPTQLTHRVPGSIAGTLDEEGEDEQAHELWVPVMHATSSSSVIGAGNNDDKNAVATSNPVLMKPSSSASAAGNQRQIGNLLVSYRIVRNPEYYKYSEH